MKNPQIIQKLNSMMIIRRKQDAFIRSQIIRTIIDHELAIAPETCPVSLFDALHDLEIDQLNDRMFSLILAQEEAFYSRILSNK